MARNQFSPIGLVQIAAVYGTATSEPAGSVAWSTAGYVLVSNGAAWDRVGPTTGDRLPNWAAGVAYAAGDEVVNGGLIYTCLAGHTSSAPTIPPNVTYWYELSSAAAYTPATGVMLPGDTAPSATEWSRSASIPTGQELQYVNGVWRGWSPAVLNYSLQYESGLSVPVAYALPGDRVDVGLRNAATVAVLRGFRPTGRTGRVIYVDPTLDHNSVVLGDGTQGNPVTGIRSILWKSLNGGLSGGPIQKGDTIEFKAVTATYLNSDHGPYSSSFGFGTLTDVVIRSESLWGCSLRSTGPTGASGRGYAFEFASGSHNITLWGFDLRGWSSSGASSSQGSVVQFGGDCSGYKVLACRFSDNGAGSVPANNHCIYLSGGPTAATAGRNGEVAGCLFESHVEGAFIHCYGSSASYPAGVHDLDVHHNTFVGVPPVGQIGPTWGVILAQVFTNGANNLRVRNNTFAGSFGYWVGPASDGAICIYKTGATDPDATVEIHSNIVHNTMSGKPALRVETGTVNHHHNTLWAPAGGAAYSTGTTTLALGVGEYNRDPGIRLDIKTPKTTRNYENGWVGVPAMHALSNGLIGEAFGYERYLSFIAPETGNLDLAEIYWVGADAGLSGYAAGVLGANDIEVRIFPLSADGWTLGTQIGATAVVPNPNMSGPRSVTSQPMKQITFASIPVQQGDLYAMTFRNVNVAPTVNYGSVNGRWVNPELGGRTPWQSDTAAWTLGTFYTGAPHWFRSGELTPGVLTEPILAVRIASKWFGRHIKTLDVATVRQSPSEHLVPGGLWYQVNAASQINSTTNVARQVFGSIEPGRITDIHATARYVSGSGSVVIELRNAAETLLASGLVPLSSSYSTVFSVERTQSLRVPVDVQIASGSHSVRVRTTGSLVAEVQFVGDATTSGYSTVVEAGLVGSASTSTDGGSTWTASSPSDISGVGVRYQARSFESTNRLEWGSGAPIADGDATTGIDGSTPLRNGFHDRGAYGMGPVLTDWDEDRWETDPLILTGRCETAGTVIITGMVADTANGPAHGTYPIEYRVGAP